MKSKNTQPEESVEDETFSLPIEKSVLCPLQLLELDLENPRLQTGTEIVAKTERDVIESLSEIAALDELVTSICTNRYLNLEPLIVLGKSASGPFTVLEGNRRLAAIKLILDPSLAEEVGISLPARIPAGVIASFQNILVHRVKRRQDSREFIGFKHINGPQRWDAYAKAKYVTEWYKSESDDEGGISIEEIAAKMGDNNNTMRAYIYAVLIIEQAEKADVWSLSDRPKTRGRFAFSHLYTALGREEFQHALGLTGGWSSRPSMSPIAKKHLKDLGEILGYLYGSISDDRTSLIKSQNPDLKDLGCAIARPEARVVLRNRGDLDQARDASKDADAAFNDALVAASLRLSRAIALLPRYSGGDEGVSKLVREIYEQADTLTTMVERKGSRRGKIGN
jgi:hypothetical protein